MVAPREGPGVEGRGLPGEVGRSPRGCAGGHGEPRQGGGLTPVMAAGGPAARAGLETGCCPVSRKAFV